MIITWVKDREKCNEIQYNINIILRRGSRTRINIRQKPVVPNSLTTDYINMWFKYTTFCMTYR